MLVYRILTVEKNDTFHNLNRFLAGERVLISPEDFPDEDRFRKGIGWYQGYLNFPEDVLGEDDKIIFQKSDRIFFRNVKIQKLEENE